MPIFDDSRPVPTAIGRLAYNFFDDTYETPGIDGYSADVFVELRDAENTVLRTVRVADLTQHLTTTEKQQLGAMFARLRALAETELL